ncbi:MAG TPA: F0F1 ATP synthase subunit A [Acidobacteriaceae bacterium]|nr:F0F1 ATP synthase subunit A [Acidobacteriaceae bacterium]
MLEQDPITAAVNKYLGKFAIQLMHLVHVQPYDPQAPITRPFAMELLVFGLLLVFFLLVRFSLSVEKPGTIQQVAEMIHGFVSDQAESIVGPGSQRFVMFCTCVLLFILLGNLLGMVPGLLAPTSVPTVPLGVALLCWFYYHYYGLRANGFHYFRQFTGPMWQIAFMMLPIELISHLARILSLTVRLYANMFAGEEVTLVFFSLVPVGIPILFMILHLGVALIQAYIFMLLTMIYVSQAIAHEH